MTSLAFYGGVNTIGGNAILLKDSGCKANIFLDYGLCLSKFKDFFSFPTDAPRYHVEEYTCTGLAPDVPEMYDSTKERFCNSIIVSHPHMDHIGATALVREDVPVYTGDASFKLYDGAMESKTKQNYAIKCHQEKGKNRFCQFRTGETLKFGEKDELRVYPHHIDHSTPGSYAFIVDASDGVVVYTGDFRRHGVVSDFTEKFVRELENLGEPVEAMVCEGTRIEGWEVPLSEDEVKSYTLDTIESACKSGVVIASTSSNDVDRIRMFWEISRELGKEMVVAPQIAITLMSLEDDPYLQQIPKPGEGSDDVRVFVREIPYHPSNKRAKMLDNCYGCDIFVDSSGVKEKAENCLFLDSWETTPIRYLDPPPGSVYILSQTEPFEEEMELDLRRLKNWLNTYGVPLYRIHTSGHIRPEEIYDIVERVQPRKFFPVHTERPRMFLPYLKNLESEIIPPKEGREYPIK